MSAFPTIGLAAVATIGLAIVFGLMILDGVLGAQGEPPVAERLQPWTKRNPWFAAVLTFMLGVLIGHFFWPGG